MIRSSFKEAFSPEWLETNITNPIHELIIIREIIPWEKIISRLCRFYDKSKGPFGKSLRTMVTILIVMKYCRLSDQEVVKQVKENRYIQYFCNVSDIGLQTFLHPSSLTVLRNRLGEQGIAILEEEVFELLRRAGIIRGDNALIDSSVLASNIIYPNDVILIFRAFKKMKQLYKLHNITIWWNDNEIRKLWRAFNLNKGNNRAAWLTKFNALFIPALKIFSEKVNSLECSEKKRSKSPQNAKPFESFRRTNN